MCIASGLRPTLYGFSKDDDVDSHNSIPEVFSNTKPIPKEIKLHDIHSERRIMNKLIEKGIIKFIE